MDELQLVVDQRVVQKVVLFEAQHLLLRDRHRVLRTLVGVDDHDLRVARTLEISEAPGVASRAPRRRIVAAMRVVAAAAASIGAVPRLRERLLPSIDGA